MPRMTAALLTAVLYLLPSHVAALGLGPVDSRLILVLDMRDPGWTVKAKLRLLPTAGPFSVWGATGTIRCSGARCPGRRAPIQGSSRAGGQGFTLQAGFRRGTICTFAGTTSDPSATNTLSCVNALGVVTLQDTFHVGGCRCRDRAPGGPGAFCATGPCPF